MKFNLERTDNVVRIKTELFDDGTVYEREFNLKTKDSESIDYATDFMSDLYGRQEVYAKAVNIANEIECDIERLIKHLNELDAEEKKIITLSATQR